MNELLLNQNNLITKRINLVSSGVIDSPFDYRHFLDEAILEYLDFGIGIDSILWNEIHNVVLLYDDDFVE